MTFSCKKKAFQYLTAFSVQISKNTMFNLLEPRSASRGQTLKKAGKMNFKKYLSKEKQTFRTIRLTCGQKLNDELSKTWLNSKVRINSKRLPRGQKPERLALKTWENSNVRIHCERLTRGQKSKKHNK